MAKKKNKMDTQESLDFIIVHMATKSDIADMATKDNVRSIVREEVANIIEKKELASKTDVRNIVHAELRDIRSELKDIRERLEALEERSKNHAGFSKEVDHVLQRVIAIEKHLGIKNKTLA